VRDERVRHTSAGAGAGPLPLGGAAPSFVSFAAAGLGAGERMFYAVVNRAAPAEWETGFGTVRGGVLTRATVLRSSARGARVAFGPGVKDVFGTRAESRGDPAADRRRVFDARDYGVAANGGDVRARLQAAVDACRAAGGGIVDVPAGDYWIDANGGAGPGSYYGGLRLASDVTLRLTPGTRLRALPSRANGYSIVWIWKCARAAIEADFGRVVGERDAHVGTTGEWGHGVVIADGATDATLRNLIVERCWGDGVFVGNLEDLSAAGRATRPRGVRLSHVIADGNRRQGLSVCGAVGFRDDAGTYVNTHGVAPASGIDLEPDLRTIENEELAFVGTRSERNEGQALSIARTKSVVFTDCYFGVDANGTYVANGRTRTTFNVEESRPTDRISSMRCTFAGPIRYPRHCTFVECDVAFDQVTDTPLYALAHDDDTPSTWHGCRFRARRFARLLYVEGSRSAATEKRFIDCDFVYEGNALPDRSAVMVVRDHVRLTGRTAVRHEGAPPATGYAIGSALSAATVWDDVRVDPRMSVGWISGRVRSDRRPPPRPE
jgi:hypothetical protein